MLKFSAAMGPDPLYNRGGPAKVGACRLFLLPESSLAVKTKNTWLILWSHFDVHSINTIFKIK